MAAAARVSAAAAAFPDIRETWLRIAGQWASLAALAARYGTAPNMPCYCGALLAAQLEPPAEQDRRDGLTAPEIGT